MEHHSSNAVETAGGKLNDSCSVVLHDSDSLVPVAYLIETNPVKNVRFLIELRRLLNIHVYVSTCTCIWIIYGIRVIKIHIDS